MVYSSVAKLRKLQAQVEAFWSEKGIEDEAKQTKSYKFAHFWVLVLKSFGRNRCPVRAGALAYTTLLALIPLLAVAAGVSTALLRNQGTAPIQKLIDKLVENVSPQLGLVSQGENARQKVTSHIWTYIQNVNSGTLGATGMIGLVLAAILLFTTVEETFNDIWGITRGRSWYLRIVQYWAGLTLGPLLLATVLILTTGPHLNWTKSVLEEVPVLGTLFYAILPFLMVSAVFAFCYRFLPNTKVRWEAALV